MKNVEVASVITVLIHRLPLPLSVPGVRPTLLLIQLWKTYFKNYFSYSTCERKVGLMQVCSTLSDSSSIKSSTVVCRGRGERVKGLNKPEPYKPNLARPQAVLKARARAARWRSPIPGACASVQAALPFPGRAWTAAWCLGQAPGRCWME